MVLQRFILYRKGGEILARKKMYQIRGLFPPGDMTFETEKEASRFLKRKKKEGYKVDRKIYRY